MVMMHDTSERARDPKVCDARLAVPSDQNVVLDVSSVNEGPFASSFRLQE
jgi:hypothetical protein